MARNMKDVMPYIHHSNPRWNKLQTIWGEAEEGIQYEYSDRLYQWDREKADKASKEAVEKAGEAFSAKRIQTYLSLYFGRKVELVQVQGGVNTSGYTYYLYGFRFKGEKK